MFSKLSTGWTAILLLCVFGFASCGEDDEDVNQPVIGTITDIAANDSRFTTLVSALQRAGLDGTLDTPSGRYTVFAPTNDAFAASGIDLDALSDDELRNVLLYHVVSGGTIFRTENIPEGQTNVNTLNTQGPSEALQVTVDRSGSDVAVNNANVVVADVLAVNGVIHAIDQVLLPPTITSIAVADGRFTTLIAALQRVDLAGVFAGAGDFTVFAPTDAAFAEAGIDLNAVSDEALTDLLRYHVLGAGIAAGSIADGDSFAATLSESGPNDSALSLLINKTDGTVTINSDAAVVVADVFASNGVIHAIDKVLAYQSIVDFATKAQDLSSLAGALTSADLVGALSADGPFTVFAPTNGAFDDAAAVIATLTPEQVATVLTYHVVGGANVRSDAIPATANTLAMQSLTFTGDGNATIVTAAGQEVPIAAVDIQGTNGVVHVIGTVLVPEL